MSMKVKIRKIGTSAGVILPKAELDRLDVKVGDELVLEQTHLGFTLDAEHAGFALRTKAFDIARRRYDTFLRSLARQ